MKDGEDIVYNCEDCEKFNLCEYYHNRKPTSQICKFFKLDQKTGKWISESEKEVTIDENGITTGSCHCSACGDWLVGSDEYPTRGRYCPNCGAKMEVDK